jgi:hypothetical protein
MDLQVSDRHLEEISRVCCEDWRSLPPHLKLETIAAKDIDKSPKVEEEKRHDFLKKWKKTKGSDATYKKLHDALIEIKSRDDAERVCKIMREVSSPVESHAESDFALATPQTNPTYTCEFAQEDALITKPSASPADISTEPVGEPVPTDPLTAKPGTAPATDGSPPTNTDSDTTPTSDTTGMIPPQYFLPVRRQHLLSIYTHLILKGELQ